MEMKYSITIRTKNNDLSQISEFIISNTLARSCDLQWIINRLTIHEVSHVSNIKPAI